MQKKTAYQEFDKPFYDIYYNTKQLPTTFPDWESLFATTIEYLLLSFCVLLF